MSSEQIVLFDIPTRDRTTWSLNPWKTRFLLNYKGLDYRTEWVEYPDIRPRLEKHIPNNGSEVPYTAPTILLPSGEYIPDSRAIATALEAAHPSPTVHLDSPFLPRLEALMRRVLRPMYPIFIPRVPKVLLSPASLPYWMETREGWFGPLDELEKGADKGWVEMGEPLKEVTAMLREDGTGPLFMGKEVSYADFVWGGFLLFCQKLGDDVWERVLEGSGDAGVHRRFLEALRPWAREDL